MDNFFLDTNILVDLLQRRQPHFESVTNIFNFAAIGKIEIYTSSHGIATLHYLCKKTIPEVELRNLINDVLDFLKIIPVDEDIIRKALKSHHKDFEDAIQIFCAHKIENLTAIITRNLRDFSTAEVNVFPPEQALDHIKNKQ